MSDIVAWLKNLGLEKYQEVFAKNEVDLEVLPKLTEQDLKELAIPLGPRKKLLEAIAALTAYDGSSSVSEPPPAAPQAERRQLTVMFVDLVGSTELSGQLDPEDLRELILSYQNTVAGEIIRFEGYVAKYMGDGVLAYFGWPRAHEDEAERAVRTGLAIIDEVARLKDPNDEPLAARIGIATGLVVVGDLIGTGAAQEEAVVGETPNLAARLQALAKPGSIVIPESTRRLLGTVFELQPLGTQVLKGITVPVSVYAVLRERAAESRFDVQQDDHLLPLIGRDQELDLLLERWRQAQSAQGQVIVLSGEAGIGKSRLIRALIDSSDPNSSSCMIYQCSPYHSDSALYPAIQQLTRAARFSATDSPESKLDKLEALLADGEDQLRRQAPLIASLIGLDGQARYPALDISPQQQRVQTLQALADQLIGLARRKPVLFIVEDAHWIDPSTLEYIDLCLDRIAQARILLLITARPVFTQGFGDHPLVTRLNLDRLGRESMAAIVGRISGGQAIPNHLLDMIAARTDGVPLFVEELTKAILEIGRLHESDNAYALDGSPETLAIPATLHDSLMARLDRVQPLKEVAQTAACIGREFDYRLLHSLSSLSENELRKALNGLVAAELIFRRGTPPDARFVFKHALVKDAAYESLLLSKRQAVHRRIIDLCADNRLQISDEILARHCLAAARYERAFALLMSAGQAARDRSAMEEATRHFEAAIQALQRYPAGAKDTNSALQAWLAAGTAGLVARGHLSDKAVKALAAAQNLAQQMNCREALFQATHGLYYHHQAAGRLDQALELAQQLVQIASILDDLGYELVALRALAAAELYAGRFSRADELCTEVIERGADASLDAVLGSYGPDPYLNTTYKRIVVLVILGYPDTAIAQATASLDYAQREARPINLAACLALLAVAYFLIGRTAEAQTFAEALCRVSEQHAFGMYYAIGDAFARPDHQDQATLRRQGMPAMLCEVLALMRASCLSAQQADRSAIADVQMLISEIDRKGFGWMSAELRRFLARAHLAQDRTDAAQQALEVAIQVSRSQKARWFELRACRDLAYLWVKQGKRQAAYDLLAPVYNGFTEGFDTTDLKDAKTLLDELA